MLSTIGATMRGSLLLISKTATTKQLIVPSFEFAKNKQSIPGCESITTFLSDQAIAKPARYVIR